MSELVDQLAFDDPLNTNGWNQGFDITYNMEDFRDQPLQVFIVPHSHNDPGGCGQWVWLDLEQSVEILYT